MVQRKPRLTAENWAAAALSALVDRGVSAVAVEPLAAALGATKGSFYWHFADRGALVDAALALWEDRETEGVIAHLSTVEEPAERLRLLLELVLTAREDDNVVRLFRDVDDPRVHAALERVTRRRLGYLVEQLEACGFDPEAARTRGTLCYAVYLGWWQLRRTAPDAAPPGPGALPHVELLQELLLDPSRQAAATA
jgi:AcrR family transcriptional regulator